MKVSHEEDNFKAIGKFIDSIGLVDILMQVEVLAVGSIKSFREASSTVPPQHLKIYFVLATRPKKNAF